jgi:kynurenine formamidase
VEAGYRDRRNWGRWGRDDQVGAVNLITPAKRVAATRLVKTGRPVSLSRVFEPEQHFIRLTTGEDGGSIIDYYGFIYHGQTVTHIDALCHVWDQHGMWNGRSPEKEIDTRGARFADITAWSGGLITRGVLLDVPRHRREPHVTMDNPVHGWELEEIARAQGVEVAPGDALMVYSGREAFVRGAGSYAGSSRPGLHASCAKFIRDHDVALLGWDMMDARPDGYGLRWPMHGVLFSYGVALLDNALLEPLAAACAEERRYEFMFMALPLKVARGTGSPANPIALF